MVRFQSIFIFERRFWTKVFGKAPLLTIFMKKYLAIGTYVLGNFKIIFNGHLAKSEIISYICIQKFGHVYFFRNAM